MRQALRDPEVVYRRRWFTLLVLCISLIVITLDNTILNVAIPTLAHPTSQGGLGATASQLQWIVDAYTLVFAGLLLTAGSLGDRFGRYRFLAIGLAIFGTGSALSAFASSAGMLIFTRALMGIGGACIMPSTLSIITNVFTDPAERGKAIGVWAGVSALGIGLGPITGGFLLQHFWWGSVFIVNVPIVLAGLALGFFLVPESKDPGHAALDPVGAGLSILGLGWVLWAVIEAPSRGWGSSGIVAALVLGLAVLAVFFTWELHTPSPMLDMHFFEDPRFSAASGAITLVFLALFGTLFLMTQYLQSVLGYSTVKAGAVLLPQAATLMIFAPLSNVWVQRWGNKRVVATGLLIVTSSLLLFLTYQPNSSVFHVIFVTVVMGLGMANILAPCTDSIMGSLPRAKAGVGSAVNDTTRQMGGAIGVAVFGSLMASHYTSSFVHSVSSTVPGGLVAATKNNVGSAIAFAKQAPQARPYAAEIVRVANHSFVSGLHIIGLVAAGVTLTAAIGVARFLPARAREQEPNAALEERTAVEAVPARAVA
ncbi:MAG TPA: DHA2 family efflux MFS transporter permease subunit [Acidimicrobiales bacterium]|nr:DHA2 family efflux MFS transporter permease subunit [Acidimicrobiales bacterium]